jgi:GNAT superfamily N-acetyltransferase
MIGAASEVTVPATVRSLALGDVPRLLDLIDGLADYEKLDRPDPGARERLARDAGGPSPRFRTLLADIDGQTVGYAIYFFTYSTFLARPTLYLEDIFVLPDYRGRGAGKALFRAVAAEAVRQECGRMEWQVLDWNQPSIDFYERNGARLMKEWVPCRLTGEALVKVAES